MYPYTWDTHALSMCLCRELYKDIGSHCNVQDMYMMLYTEQKHANTGWLRLHAPTYPGAYTHLHAAAGFHDGNGLQELRV